MQRAKIFNSPKRFYSTIATAQSPSPKAVPILPPKKYPKGAPLNQTLPQIFQQKVEQFEYRDFLRVPFENIRWTYLEAQRGVELYSNGFAALWSSEKGARVAWMLPNGTESALLTIATAHAGSIYTMFKNDPSADELCALIDHVKPKGLFWRPNTIHASLYQDMKKIVPEFSYYPINYRKNEPWWCDRFPGLRDVIQCDDRAIIEAQFITLNALSCEADSKKAVKKTVATLKPEDPVASYTEIKNSVVKVKVYSHIDIANAANNVSELIGLEQGDRVCLSFNLNSPLGHAVGIWSTFTSGAYVVIPSEFFNPEEHIKAISEESCNTLIASPEYAKNIFSHPNAKKVDWSKIKKVLIVSDEPIDSGVLNLAKGFKLDVQTHNPTEKVKGKELAPVYLDTHF